ncbi:MAG: hypothetical protein KF726_03990 [Anaerolineae bacterium]|nr:hypothetical protein [Anaerolineae bacterium]
MTRTRILLASLAVVLAFSLLINLRLGSVVSVAAQEAVTSTSTVIASPTNNGGSAEWTISTDAFVSKFPRGGEFSLKASSSAGKITSAFAFFQVGTAKSRRRATAQLDQDTGTWIGRWDITNIPPFVPMSYYWVITDEAGNTYQTDLKDTSYADNDNEWIRSETEDIIIYQEPGLPDIYVQKTLEAMAFQRDFYLKHWGTLLKYKPVAVLYNGYQRWSAWRPGIAGGNTSIGGERNTFTVGQALTDYGVFVGTARYNSAELSPDKYAFGIILHEIGHLYQGQNGGFFGASMPLWFSEGDAEFFNAYMPEVNGELRTARVYAQEGRLPRLMDIGDNGLLSYFVGVSFWTWLTEAYGDDIHLQIVQRLAKNKNWRDALEETTGRNFLDLETEFRQWLGIEEAAPPTSLPTLTPPPFFATPTFAPTKTPKP